MHYADFAEDEVSWPLRARFFKFQHLPPPHADLSFRARPCWLQSRSTKRASGRRLARRSESRQRLEICQMPSRMGRAHTDRHANNMPRSTLPARFERFRNGLRAIFTFVIIACKYQSNPRGLMTGEPVRVARTAGRSWGDRKRTCFSILLDSSQRPHIEIKSNAPSQKNKGKHPETVSCQVLFARQPSVAPFPSTDRDIPLQVSRLCHPRPGFLG
jgi:hypothetical protein